VNGVDAARWTGGGKERSREKRERREADGSTGVDRKMRGFKGGHQAALAGV
jgi:hypothetical protein